MRQLLILIPLCFLWLGICCQGDSSSPAQAKRLVFKPGLPVTKKNIVHLGKALQAVRENVQPVVSATDENTCTTTTFYMRLPASAGEKISIQNVQTLPNGNFVACANAIQANESKGFVIQMKTDGTIITRKQLSISNSTARLYKLKVLMSGDIILTGVNNISKKVFIACLAGNFATKWIKEFAVSETPANISLDIYSNYDIEEIALAVQQTESIIYSRILSNGSFIWSRQVTINDLVRLDGFTYRLYDSLSIVATCNVNGLIQTKLLALDLPTGKISSGSIIGDGTGENDFKAVTNFDVRLTILGATKVNGNFKLQRNTTYSALSIETQHTYNLPEAINFNSSFALDNAGDAMGICIPEKGKLLFVKQFNYYYTKPEFVTEYDVPVGSVLTSVARSFDGGFLFNLNNQDSSEAVFIKTDSIGVLAGCSYKALSGKSTELYQVPNKAITNVSSSSSNLITGSPPLVTKDIGDLPSIFDCRENYCPVSPPQDTCLSTYFKILRSGSYADYASGPMLMRNNNILMYTSRYDRILGGTNRYVKTLKLFNEKAEYITGKDFVLGEDDDIVIIQKMSDSAIMVVSYKSSYNNDEEYTFTLISDALEIIWSKSYEIHVNSDLFGHVLTDGKNFYYYNAGPGYLGYKSRLTVFKMDENGNGVWLKRYSLPTGYSSQIIATATAGSLVFVQDAGGKSQGASYSIDKNTGVFINGYTFNSGWSGSMILRQLRYEKNRLYYLGSNEDENLVAGIFDSTGLPLTLKVFKDYFGARSATVYDSKTYISVDHYNQGHYSDVLICLDSDLNTVFANAYDMSNNYRLAGSVQVSKDGNIYVGGNSTQDYNYYNPYIIKYDNNGHLGTCGFVVENPTTVSIDPKPGSITATVADSPVVKLNIPIDLVTGTPPLTISAILCSSSPLCSSLKIAGPRALCSLDTDYTYQIQKNAGCNLRPVFLFDTAFVSMKKNTDTTFIVRFRKGGTTKLKIVTNAGCSVIEDSLIVQLQESSSELNLGSDTTICSGKTVYLNAGEGFFAYAWQNGSSDSVFKVTQAGKYYVQVTDACNNYFSDTVYVNAATLPRLSIGADTAVCAGNALQLTASPGFKQYNWFPAAVISNNKENASIVVQQDEMLYVKATSYEGCIASDSMNISARFARPVNLGNDTSFCDYDSLILNAGSGYRAFQWNDGYDAQIRTVNKAGSYNILAEDTNGCFATDTIVVDNVFPHPAPYLGNDRNICNGSTITLNAGNYHSYAWQDGSSSQLYKVEQPGIYWVTVTDNNGCRGNDTFEVQKLFAVPSGFLMSVDSLCRYDKLMLQPSGTFTQYFWSTGSANQSIVVTTPGTYSLNVTDTNGCTGADEIKIVEKDCMHGIYIPSAFTPNHDGKNDVFRPLVFGKVLKYNLSIYNRFGELVFSTTDYLKGWDGLVHGQPQNNGTYVWQCSCKLEGDENVFKKGTVVLLH